VIEPSGGGRTDLVSVRHGHDAPITSDVVDRIVAGHALASGPERPLLEARLRVAAGTRLVDQPGAHGAPSAVIVNLSPARPEWPFAIDPEAALSLAAIDEAPTVIEAARTASRRDGLPFDAAVARVVAVARDALRRGALERQAVT
jgi:hypothetical protein